MKKNDVESGLREKILNTAVRILRESGLKKLAQPQIAKEAKIRQSHLTYYFPKRADLILAITERSMLSIHQLVTRHLSSGLAKVTEKKLRSLVAGLLSDRSRTRALIGLLVESDENPELRAKLRDLSNQESALVAQVYERSASDPKVAVAHAALTGIAIQSYLHEGKRDREIETWIKSLEVWLKDESDVTGSSTGSSK